MFRLISTLINKPILSLQTSSSVGKTIGALIDPNKLRVIGFHVQSPNDTGSILLWEDIREISSIGIIVDRYDHLAHPEELVRLKPILKVNYKLVDKQVVDESGQKYGRVSDYVVDEQTFLIAKLYTKQNIIRSFAGGALVVDRGQIIEVNKKSVVIRNPLGGMESETAAAVAGA